MAVAGVSGTKIEKSQGHSFIINGMTLNKRQNKLTTLTSKNTARVGS